MDKRRTTKPVTIEFIKSQCTIDEKGCWNWNRTQSCGYGRIRRENKLLCVHRVAFEVAHPELNMEGIDVKHTCGNRLCCNPEHMKTVQKCSLVASKSSKSTATSNADGSAKKYRYTIAVCKRCHQDYRSSGLSEICQDCYQGRKPDRNPYRFARTHRCPDCGVAIETKECVACNTLKIIAKQKNEQQKTLSVVDA